MAYTTIDKPSDYFNTKLYTGNGSTGQSITGVGFQPDWTWLKLRSTTGNHGLFDAVRGATKRLQANQTNAEDTIASFASFDSDGFTLSEASQNNSGETFVSWNWLGANGTASNSDGSITSTVSANTTSGFSIVSYTGNGSAGATVGHGIDTPKMIIVKKRSGVSTWNVYHEAIGNTKGLYLNTTDATTTYTGFWNDTSPTSSVFTVGADNTTNSATYIAYCFAEKKGYSKFGSYTGNGNADGRFVFCGFKPSFVMVKNVNSGVQGWLMFDDKRSTFNVANKFMVANLSQAEASTSTHTMDFLSNGFKIRGTDGGVNGSGNTLIYMCFASSPFTTSTGIPSCAR